MPTSTALTSDHPFAAQVSVAVDRPCVSAAAPVKVLTSRALTAWYRALAARAANPALWESHLPTAEHLEAEAVASIPNKRIGKQRSGVRDNR